MRSHWLISSKLMEEDGLQIHCKIGTWTIWSINVNTNKNSQVGWRRIGATLRCTRNMSATTTRVAIDTRQNPIIIIKWSTSQNRRLAALSGTFVVPLPDQGQLCNLGAYKTKPTIKKEDHHSPLKDGPDDEEDECSSTGAGSVRHVV